MHSFDYKETPKHLLTPDIVNMLSSLHEFKGKQELFIKLEPDVLTALLDIAKIMLLATLKLSPKFLLLDKTFL
jgi:hypothetical protein